MMLQFGTLEDAIGHSYILGRIGEKIVGYLKLGSPRPFQDNARIVLMVWVDEKHRRQGVASALWRFAKENGYKPVHELQKSEDGKAWAMAVGD